jgi:hypothetical protein
MSTYRVLGRVRLATIAIVMAVAGCGSDHVTRTTESSAPAVSHTPSAIPSAQSQAEEAVLAAYKGMWDSFVEASKTSDPDAPDIRKYASDNALKLIVGALLKDRTQKKVTLGNVAIDPKVTASSATEATILDCVNDEKWLVYKASGGLVNDVPGGKHRTTAKVKKANGVWKVNSFKLEDSGTC